MIAFPNAKINLGLDVLRRRDDGYHDIATVMVAVDWCDVLEIIPAAGDNDTLHVTGNKVDCPPHKNLVIKALNAMRTATDIPPVDIYLHKNIPDGAGLGGGSADAAYALTTLNTMFGKGLSTDTLRTLAAGIGSDCAFFIDNSPALCTGRGEILTPADDVAAVLADKCVVIVKPDGCSVSTAAAYAGVTPRQRTATPCDILRQPVEQWRQTLTNDFEQSVFAIYPQVGQIKQHLYDAGALYAAMSGSGSAVYGIFEHNKALVEQLKNRFAAHHFFAGKCRINEKSF